jgi:hypothetical protein
VHYKGGTVSDALVMDANALIGHEWHFRLSPICCLFSICIHSPAVADVGSLPAPKAGDGEHDRDDNDRRGVRYRSPRSLILRKTRSACDRGEPFHRMIGIYFSLRL